MLKIVTNITLSKIHRSTHCYFLSTEIYTDHTDSCRGPIMEPHNRFHWNFNK